MIRFLKTSLRKVKRIFDRFKLGKFTPGGQHRQAGYTLLELLIVLGILALLATVAAPRLIQYFAKSKTEIARIQVTHLGSAIELYYLDTGKYPPQDAGVAALMTGPAGVANWNGPYLKKSSGLTDPWGHSYFYRFPGEHGDFDVYSLGRDGQPGGTDEDQDLTSW